MHFGTLGVLCSHCPYVAVACLSLAAALVLGEGCKRPGAHTVVLTSDRAIAWAKAQPISSTCNGVCQC